MAIIHMGNYTINKTISTAAFVINEVEVIDNQTFAVGRGSLANMKVSLSLTVVDETTVEVGYMVINQDNRLLSYKGKFMMVRVSSVSEQVRKALQCL